MITKYGYDVVGVVILVVVVLSLLSWFLIDARVVKFSIMAVSLAFLVFTVGFFRDPERVTPPGPNLVIAPADGKIVQIADTDEPEFVRGPAVQVSIFMSPLNVHVNRYPISGIVRYFRHFPGEFLVAFDDKASLRNERTHIGVENGSVRVLFKQIAGFIARRIVAPIAEGDSAVAGRRFGMIRFGSRVDVLLPRGARMKVALGDATTAGETILAEIPQP